MRLWVLAAIAMVCGAGTAAVFRRLANRRAAASAGKRMVAHLQEIRLYADEPALIVRAQLAAMRESLRLFEALMKPTLLMALPMAWLLVQLDAGIGHAPLHLNEAGIVTVHLTRELNAADARASLTAPPEIAVETPPVRSFAEREISWRVRARGAVESDLTVQLPEGRFTKSIAAGAEWRWVSPCEFRRVSGLLLHPWDGRLAAGNVKWIAIDYPEVSWLGWFLAFSTVGAALGLLRR